MATSSKPVPVPPRGEIGAEAQRAGFDGWSVFVDEAEHVPELAWPASITTYHKMRSDSQIDALHIGTTMPVREYRWCIAPNGAPAKLAEQAAADLGLPVQGSEERNVERSASLFDFDGFLCDVLLTPLYGFHHFEIVADQSEATGWQLGRFAPRHPRTIQDFQTTPNGDLLAIRQNIEGSGQDRNGMGVIVRLPRPIPANKLLTFVWRREAGSHVGRSMLRSMYREWLVKDRAIRIAAINLERAGGVPVIEGPPGAQDQALANLAVLARQFKVSEGGGGAIPFGSKLHLVGGNVPDAISLLQYCDQAMARVWALMLIQLGQTQTGSRALGSEFTDYAALTQRAIGGWVCSVMNRFLAERYTEWNDPSSKFAPRLVFEQAKPDALSTEHMVALLDAGALTVDPELEDWIRSEHGLPVKPEASRMPDTGPADPPPPVVAPPADPPAAPVVASGPRAVAFAATHMPDRELRRQPYEHEVRAAVDFRALDQVHEATVGGLEVLYLGDVIPRQIDALAAGITTTKAGEARKRLTRAAMAALTAPVEGRDELLDHLATAARAGAAAAVDELAEQGYYAVAMPDDEALAALVSDQADAVSAMNAHGISLSAQRKATSLVAAGRTPEVAAAEVSAHLRAMKHQWTLDQLRGSVTMAQNAGRASVFEQVPEDEITYHASEILDVNCCGPCTGIDGREFESLAEARLYYSSGGYNACEGGPRCRGTIVAVQGEQDTQSGPLG